MKSPRKLYCRKDPFYDASEIRLLCCQISGVIHLSGASIGDPRLLLFILIYWDFQTIYTVVRHSLFNSFKTICRYLSVDRYSIFGCVQKERKKKINSKSETFISIVPDQNWSANLWNPHKIENEKNNWLMRLLLSALSWKFSWHLNPCSNVLKTKPKCQLLLSPANNTPMRLFGFSISDCFLWLFSLWIIVEIQLEHCLYFPFYKSHTNFRNIKSVYFSSHLQCNKICKKGIFYFCLW